MGPFTSERTKEDLLTVARQNGWIMEGDAELLSALYDKAMAKNDLGLEMLLDDIYSLQVPQRYMREYMMDHYIEILGGEYYAEEREMLKQLRNGWRRDVGTFYGHDYDDLHSYIEKNTGAFALSEDFQNSKRNSAAFRIRCQAMGWVQEGDDKLVDAVYDAFLDPHHMNPALKTEAQAVLYLMMNMPVNNEDHRRQMLNLMQDVWNIAVGATKKDNVPMVDYFKPEEKVISDLNTRIQGARSVKRLPQQEFDKRMDAARRAPALKEWSKEGQERSIKERMDERRKFRDKSDRWQKQIREEQQRKLNEEEERQRQEQERIERERAEARKAQLLKEAEELRKRLEAEKAAYDAQKYSPIPEVPLNVSYTGKRTATSANDPEGKLYHTEDAALVLSTQLFMTYMQAFPLLEKEGNIDRIAPITAYIAANPIKDVHQKKYDNFDGGKVKMFDFNATVYSEDTQQLKDMLKTLEDTFTELADKAKDPGIKESYQSLAYICRTDQGNFARAMEENPLLQGLKAVSIMGVRNSEEYPEEECIKGLKGQHPSQAHLPEEQRIDISADVFTLQGAFGRELKLEYRRQQLERGGYADMRAV